MPNWITNIVTIHGERAEEIRQAIKTEERVFDFNKIIPRHPDLDITSGTETDKVNPYIKSGTEPPEDAPELIKKAYANWKRFGHTTWYGWSNDNWGTKWNACDSVRNEDGTLRFDTAWSCPYKVFEALSRMFPNTKFEVKYADEDLGHNFGHFEVKNGEVVEHELGIDYGTREGVKWAREVKGWEDEDDDA